MCSIVKSLARFAAMSVLLALPVHGQNWQFQERPFYNPLIAEPRAATVNVMFLGFSGPYEFSQKSSWRRVWDISLGKEIPLAGREKRGTAPGLDRLEAGEWGWGFWIPVSFHMIEDFRDKSNPILNTDYRFAWLQFKAQRGFSYGRWGLKLQSGHESTHLGDEFSLAARRSAQERQQEVTAGRAAAPNCAGPFSGGTSRPECFERINVSYEYWEYGISFEKDRSLGSGTSAASEHFTLRTGGIGLLRPYKGYYEGELLEAGIGGRTSISRSSNNFEPSLAAEWYRAKEYRWLLKRGPFVSLDTRYSKVYDYNKRTRHDPDWEAMVIQSACGNAPSWTAISAKRSSGLLLPLLSWRQPGRSVPQPP